MVISFNKFLYLISISFICISFNINAENKWVKGSICDFIEKGFKPFHIRVTYAKRVCLKVEDKFPCYASNYKAIITKGKRKNEEIGIVVPYGRGSFAIGYEYLVFLDDVDPNEYFPATPLDHTIHEWRTYQAPDWAKYYALEQTIFLKKNNQYYREIMFMCWEHGIDMEDCKSYGSFAFDADQKTTATSYMHIYPNLEDELKQCKKL